MGGQSSATIPKLRNLMNFPIPAATMAVGPREGNYDLGFFNLAASRASLSALRRLRFAWNSGSAWLSDIFCLNKIGLRALRSISSATCCSADRFILIICFLLSGQVRRDGWFRITREVILLAVLTLLASAQVFWFR